MNAALLGWLCLVGQQPRVPEESCGVCHGEIGLAERGAAHQAAGIGCVDCHGGNEGVVTLPEAHGTGARVPRGPRMLVESCLACHSDPERMHASGLRTDQGLLFWTSAHGQRLAQAEDPDVAICSSCHGAHGVRSASDPRSPVHALRQAETCGRCHADAALAARHELQADVVTLYRESVHGRALHERGSDAAPACTACHGSHGATPPRVDHVGRVCARCHTAVQARFEQGPHFGAARDGRLEECVSCHGSHAVRAPSTEMLVGERAGQCGSCHESDPAAQAVGAGMHGLLTAFDARIRETEEALAGAARSGLFVEPESDMLGEARALRRRAGPLVHALSVQALGDLLERGDGMLEKTREGIQHRERELRDRRAFVAVFLAVDLLLAALLLVHAREVAGRATGAPGSFEPWRPASGGGDG